MTDLGWTGQGWYRQFAFFCEIPWPPACITSASEISQHWGSWPKPSPFLSRCHSMQGQNCCWCLTFFLGRWRETSPCKGAFEKGGRCEFKIKTIMLRKYCNYTFDKPEKEWQGSRDELDCGWGDEESCDGNALLHHKVAQVDNHRQVVVTQDAAEFFAIQLREGLIDAQNHHTQIHLQKQMIRKSYQFLDDIRQIYREYSWRLKAVRNYGSQWPHRNWSHDLPLWLTIRGLLERPARDSRDLLLLRTSS